MLDQIKKRVAGTINIIWRRHRNIEKLIDEVSAEFRNVFLIIFHDVLHKWQIINIRKLHLRRNRTDHIVGKKPGIFCVDPVRNRCQRA